MTSRESGGAGTKMPRSRGAWILTGAAAADRVFTWGLEPTERSDLPLEREADRFDHLADPDASLPAVVIRSFRSAFADLAYRFLGGEVSALPLAILLAIIGLGAIADTITSHLPVMLNVFNLLTGVGFLALAVAGFANPRELRRRWLLPGAVLVFVGAVAGAILLPVEGGSVTFDWVTKIALGGAGLGFGIIAGSLVASNPNRVWYQRGGMLVWGSGLFLGIGLFGLALLAQPVYSTRASTLVVATASVVGTALLSRFRHVPVAS